MAEASFWPYGLGIGVMMHYLLSLDFFAKGENLDRLNNV
tara:strand:+ start:99 stop:215 length:117 start_codon:yes stop_codon:yes gene_type:complete